MNRLFNTDKISIRAQIVTMFLIVVLPSFAASIFLLVSMRNVVAVKSLETATSNADTIGFWLSDSVSMGEQCAENVAQNKTIVDFITGQYADDSMFLRFYSENTISKLVNIPSQVSNVKIYLERDDFVYNSTFLRAYKEILNADWYQAVKTTGRMSWFVIKNESDKVVLSCVNPIKKNDEIVGIAVINMSNDWVSTLSIDDMLYVVLSMDGIVYSSNFPVVPTGVDLRTFPEYKTTLGTETYPEGIYGYKGYAVVKNMHLSSDSFQIGLFLSGNFINEETDRTSFIYGGYCALMIVMSLLIILLFTNTFSTRIKVLSAKIHEVTGGNFDVQFEDSGSDEISLIYTDIQQMVHSMQSLITDNYETKLQSEQFKLNQVQAEFKALSSQINPHFLYNTLETIRMKAYVNNDKETAQLVKKLGKFMRRCLEFKDSEVTLESELEFTKAYLELQGARFGDRISYHIYSEVTGEYMILPLLIQPLVENAFVHGVEASKGGGRIDIKVYYHNDCVYVDVADNGQGMNAEKLRELEYKLEVSDTSSGKSIGLTNVHKRIQMYHGKRYGMRVQSKEGQGTTIRLVLPREPKHDKLTMDE